VSGPVLEIEGLEVRFPTDDGDVQAVRGVDLTIDEDEVLGIVGESGSGKSVTMLAVMGLLPRSAKVSGSVRLRGRELLTSHGEVQRQLRGKEMAMIFQDPLSALNPVYRVGTQIAEMVRAHTKVSKAEAARRAVGLLDRVGIPQPDARARRYPHEFSGGMRQRAMIAMAIANNPALLIADEPTTALDVTIQAQILDVIKEIQAETHSAVAFITHDLGVIARLADRVQVMYAGKAVERAPVRELFDRPSHPYTEGLLNALPGLGRERLTPIPGAPPNMLAPPSGCAFRVRCPYAIERCAEEEPLLREVAPHQSSACHRAEDVLALRAARR
jgi:oligopeptide/dipeptide ABC transporter ATP-binding protein